MGQTARSNQAVLSYAALSVSSTETGEVALIAAGCVVGLTMLCAVAAYSARNAQKRYKRYLKNIEVKAAEKQRDLKRLEDAITGTRKLGFPFVLMPLEKFRSIGRLIAHEAARDAGHLTFLDEPQNVTEFVRKNTVLFISHQWLGFTQPDPQNIHYPAIVAAAEALLASKRISERYAWIWCDYFSIPQANKICQIAAIGSIPHYASNSAYFLVCAPPALHADTGAQVDVTSYLRRGWCRLECWSYLSLNTVKRMYMLIDEGYHDRVQLTCFADKEECLHSVLEVMHGDFTVETDRLLLVDVILGLHALGRLYRNLLSNQLLPERSALNGAPSRKNSAEPVQLDSVINGAVSTPNCAGSFATATGPTTAAALEIARWVGSGAFKTGGCGGVTAEAVAAAPTVALDGGGAVPEAAPVAAGDAEEAAAAAKLQALQRGKSVRNKQAMRPAVKRLMLREQEQLQRRMAARRASMAGAVDRRSSTATTAQRATVGSAVGEVLPTLAASAEAAAAAAGRVVKATLVEASHTQMRETTSARRTTGRRSPVGVGEEDESAPANGEILERQLFPPEFFGGMEIRKEAIFPQQYFGSLIEVLEAELASHIQGHYLQQQPRRLSQVMRHQRSGLATLRSGRRVSVTDALPELQDSSELHVLLEAAVTWMVTTVMPREALMAAHDHGGATEAPVPACSPSHRRRFRRVITLGRLGLRPSDAPSPQPSPQKKLANSGSGGIQDVTATASAATFVDGVSASYV
mmetsp:Transcript_43568/g.128294  ORF Transcript_43568/g.128294 Transcript_43568/m.128294 type:complete len:749 (-) Transcript_43568:295-2541(-)